MREIGDKRQFDDIVRKHPAVAIWFSSEECSVCHVLLPKVSELLAEEFPRVVLVRVDCMLARELAAEQGVFSIPTLLLCFDGHEVQRLVRNFSLGQVREAIARPYQLLFE